MPEKDGDDKEKSTKSVVTKRQKQMMGEEGYDIARDMGRVKPSKDKKDATTLPVSDEVKKTRKVNKGPSAFELVKKKYKGQIMDVSKKKANEELDLTKVAESFGGYIVEAPLQSLTGNPEEIEKKIKKGYLKTQDKEQATRDRAYKDMKMDRDPKFSKVTDEVKKGLRKAKKDYDTGRSGEDKPISGEDILLDRIRQPLKRRAQRVKGASGEKPTGSIARGTYKSSPEGQKAYDATKKDIEAKRLLKKAGSTGDIGFDAPNRKEKVKKRTDRADSQGTPDPFSIDTSKAAKDVAKAFGRKPVKGGLPMGTPTVPSGEYDRYSPEGSRSSVEFSKDDPKIAYGSGDSLKDVSKTKKKFSQFSKKLQDLKRDIKVDKDIERKISDVDVKKLVPIKKKKGEDYVRNAPKIGTGTALDPEVVKNGRADKAIDVTNYKEPSALAKSAAATKTFLTKNPVGQLMTYDMGKGILGKIKKLRIPKLVGGRAINVSARGGGAA